MTTSSVLARDIMISGRSVITITPDQDVFEVINLLVRNKISGAPVVDKSGKYLGIFSERSCISLMLDAAQRGTPTNRIEPFIDTEAITITPDTDLWTIAQILMNTAYRRLPVIKQGKVIGLVSRRDVLKAANKLLDPQKPHESGILYVSAIREKSEAPVA
ncbi:MAG: CBS domain-containing protein [Planctomycetaceae bacterium]|nr:CBS domain-containing protein [Planctomycetaceae bacterium]